MEAVYDDILLWFWLYLTCMVIGHVGYRYIPDNNHPDVPDMESQFKSFTALFSIRYGRGLLFIPLFFSNIFFALFTIAFLRHVGLFFSAVF